MTRVFSALAVALLCAGCVKAPRIHVASASAEQIRKASELNAVWYHFKEGDVIPFSPLFYGAGVGGLPEGVPVQVQRDFYLVFQRGRPITLSLNGRSRMQTGKTILTITPAESGTGGRVNWITYLGNPTQAENDLEALLKPVE